MADRRETPQSRYAKKALRRLAISLNRNTDQDILAKLDTVDNVTGYIKRLIRADLAKNPE